MPSNNPSSGKGATSDQHDRRRNCAGATNESANRKKGGDNTQRTTPPNNMGGGKNREAFEEGFAYKLLEEARQKQKIDSAISQKLSDDATILASANGPDKSKKNSNHSDEESDSGESLFNEIDAIYDTHRAAEVTSISTFPTDGIQSVQQSRFFGKDNDNVDGRVENVIMPWKTSASLTCKTESKSHTPENSWSVEGILESIKPSEPAKTENVTEPTNTDKSEEPKKTDKIEDSTKIDKIEEPTKSDKIEEPKMTDNIEDPTKAESVLPLTKEELNKKLHQEKEKVPTEPSSVRSSSVAEARSTPKLTPRSTFHPSPHPPTIGAGKGLPPPNYAIATSLYGSGKTPPQCVKPPGEGVPAIPPSAVLNPALANSNIRPCAVTPYSSPQAQDMSTGGNPSQLAQQNSALYAQIAHQHQLLLLQQQQLATQQQQRQDQQHQVPQPFDQRNLAMYQEYSQKIVAELTALQKAPQSAHQVPEHQRPMYLRQIEEKFAALQQDYAACQQKIREEVMKYQQLQLHQQPQSAQQLQAQQQRQQAQQHQQFIQQIHLPGNIAQQPQFAHMSPQHQSFMIQQAQQQQTQQQQQQQQQHQQYMYLQHMAQQQQQAQQQQAQQYNMTPEQYTQLLRQQMPQQ